MQILSLPELQAKVGKAADEEISLLNYSVFDFDKQTHCSHICKGSTLPDHGATIGAEAERSDCTEVTLQHTHTLTGAQIPQPNATVQRGGEQLQSVDVWVKLDEAAETDKKKSNRFQL